MTKISIFTQASSDALKDLNALMDQMSQSSHSSHRLSLSELRDVVRDRDISIAVVREGKRIIATGTLVVMHTLIGRRARLEDVVVDSGHRGKGLGKSISQYLVALAKKKKATSIEFTSRPSRIAAVALYEKLGFAPHDTSVYRLTL